jgi:uncharacterized coiled-coil protein SlyX
LAIALAQRAWHYRSERTAWRPKVAAEKTLEERVTDLERLLPAQIRALSRLNDQETASIKADFATLRAQMLAGFASIESRLDGMEDRLGGMENRLGTVERRLGTVERDLSDIKHTLDALPRVLAEELAKRR